MKKILSCALIFLMLGVTVLGLVGPAGAAPMVPGASPVFGDVNNDGIANAQDIVVLQKHILGTAYLMYAAFDAGDLNQDGIINAQDIVVLQKIILGTWEDPNPVIRFWQAGADTMDAQNMMMRILEAFTAETGVRIEYETYPWSQDPHTIFDKALAKGDVPDLMVVGNPHELLMAEKDQLLPLDAYMEQEILDDLMGVFSKECKYYGPTEDLYGQYISMPLFGSARTILFNKKLFDEKGIAYPDSSWTQDQLYENAKALTFKKNGTQVYGFATSAYYASQYLPFLWNYGGELLTTDSSASAVAQTGAAWKQAAQYYKRFFDEGITPPGSEAALLPELVDLFKAGQVAMFIVEDPAMQDVIGVGYMPNVDGVETSFAGADALVIPKGAKHPVEAGMLINFLLRTENALEYAKVVGFLPVVKSAAEDPIFAKDPFLAPFADAVDHGRFWIKISNSSDFTTILREEMLEYLLGYNSVDQYVSNVHARFEQALKEG